MATPRPVLSRRGALLGFAMTVGASDGGETDAKSAHTNAPLTDPNLTPSAPARPARAVTIERAPSTFKEAMTRRDEAADFKCKGGMFDCDSDRRQYAKDQWKRFLARGGKPAGKAAAAAPGSE